MMISIVLINKDLKLVMWDEVPGDQWKYILYRCIQSTFANFIVVFIIKYNSMVFQGISSNMTPILTMILSYWTLKERFKVWDIVFIIVSLIGATLTTLGIKENKKLAA